MRYEHTGYEYGDGRHSKAVETYNFHKAAAVLAEYGFDCIRLADDWLGADFLAQHKATKNTLHVQLKTCLVIDRRYEQFKDLYMCFPLDDDTGNWYLVKHERLLKLVEDHSSWLRKKAWGTRGHYFIYRANKEVKRALEEFAYKACHGALGFRECTQLGRKGWHVQQVIGPPGPLGGLLSQYRLLIQAALFGAKPRRLYPSAITTWAIQSTAPSRALTPWTR